MPEEEKVEGQEEEKKLSKAQLKKLKAKQKADAEAAAAKEAGSAEAKPDQTKKADAKKPGKKLNAAAAAALKKREEAAALQAEIDAENARLQAIEDAKEAERLAEEKKLKDELEAKKAAERAKIEELKSQGKWMSKKKYQEMQAQQKKRQQLIDQGIIKEDDVQEDEATNKKQSTKIRKEKTKKNQNKQEAENENQTAEVQEEQEETKVEEKVEKTKEEEKVEPAQAEEESDDAVDDWETADVDEIAGTFDKKETPKIENNEEDADPLKQVKKAEEKVSKQTKGPTDNKNKKKQEEAAASTDIFSGIDDGADAKAARMAAARAKIAARKKGKKETGSKFRCPIVCILGHVDTGKTLILDKLRRTNVQAGEAGGITQQIGATFFPPEYIQGHANKTKEYIPFDLQLPGFLVIDTPGHESFTNLRSRGSSLCDIAILVVDIMHTLEQQTLESMELLRQKKCPFIVALNKIDRIYEWKSEEYNCVQDALSKQDTHSQQEFQMRLQRTQVAFAEQGFNAREYWHNLDTKGTSDYISLVPTSAITGEGLPDLMTYLSLMCQTRIPEQLQERNDLFDCTVLEVKVIEGLGTTIDVVLLNGVLKVQDNIVLQGMNGPIVTQIRALLTPHPMKEMRVKAEYIHHKEIKGAMGIKISAPNLEAAIAGSELIRCRNQQQIDEAKTEMEANIVDILDKYVDKTKPGVCVQASTLGSLEALLEFLKSTNISVCNISIGPVHKKDVLKAMKVLAVQDKDILKEYATILAFDVRVSPEAAKFAEEENIKIFTAEIIYHLFDQFTEYVAKCKEERTNKGNVDAIYPCVLEVIKEAIFNRKDPIIMGVNVKMGQLRTGTPLCIPEKDNLKIGVVESIELNKKKVDKVLPKDGAVSVRISGQSNINYGAHFDHTNQICSLITRKSIDALKDHCRDEMTMDDWQLVKMLKTKFDVDKIKGQQ